MGDYVHEEGAMGDYVHEEGAMGERSSPSYLNRQGVCVCR